MNTDATSTLPSSSSSSSAATTGPGRRRPPASKDKDPDRAATAAAAAAAVAAVAAKGSWGPRPQSAVLADFWARELTRAGAAAASSPAVPARAAGGTGHAPSLRQTLGLTFPMKPLKRLMKADPAVVQKVGHDAQAVMGAVLELFLRDLATRAACHMARARRTRMTVGDIAAAAAGCDAFDFLIDVLPARELDAARAATREHSARPPDDADLLTLALARQRRHGQPPEDDREDRGADGIGGREGFVHREGVALPLSGAAGRTGGAHVGHAVHTSPPASPEASSPAQLLQQQHLQTLMALSAHAGTSVLPVAHEYAALAAAALAAAAAPVNANTNVVPPPAPPGDIHSLHAPLHAGAADAELLSHAQDHPEQGLPDAAAVQETGPQGAAAPPGEGTSFLPFFAFQPADAGVEGLSTVAIAHEAAEAESMDRTYTAPHSVQPSAFPTLWAQQPQIPEREELPDDEDYDDDDFADEEFDLYDPDEEDDGDEDDEDEFDVDDDGDSNNEEETPHESTLPGEPPQQRPRHHANGGT